MSAVLSSGTAPGVVAQLPTPFLVTLNIDRDSNERKNRN
jgi:hypothetical protein